MLPAYQAQEQLLNAIHEREKIDRFVASYTGVENQGGELVSYCLWIHGVEAHLPKAQKVVLMKEPSAGLAVIGDWDRVREVAGSLMEETDHYPPRFRVREFPHDAALAAIGMGEI